MMVITLTKVQFLYTIQIESKYKFTTDRASENMIVSLIRSESCLMSSAILSEETVLPIWIYLELGKCQL
jgi:hypothetical protein